MTTTKPPGHSRSSVEITHSQFERILNNAYRMSIVVVAVVVIFWGLYVGQVILAPLTLAIIIGLMFGPVADMMERRGVPPALSAGIVLLSFIGMIVLSVFLFAAPLSEWVDRAPQIWEKLRAELMNWKEPLEALANLQDQVKGALGTDTTLTVAVEEGSTVTELAMLAPHIAAQVLIFLATLFFYMATRRQIQIAVLSLCVTRRLRWRTAHIFSDVETRVSKFLLSVTFLNFCVGVAVGLSMWALGVPSPLLWGALAMMLNYIPYVGHAIMFVILLAVGLGTQTGLPDILLPVGAYVVINFVEGQLITPAFLGKTMTLNPLLIFISISFWLTIWGPVGALVAVPMLLLLQSTLIHILPGRQLRPTRPVRVTPSMSQKDVILATAAAAIRERAQEEKAAEEAKEEAKEALKVVKVEEGVEATIVPEPAPPADPAPVRAPRRRAPPPKAPPAPAAT